MKEQLSCVVSGSFKFKPEIDRAIEELEDYGVKVWEPEKGWLPLPESRRLLRVGDEGYRPLPSEKGLDSKQIEDRFLAGLRKSDFMYIVAPEGYAGIMVNFEIGGAMALLTPVFASEPIKLVDPDPWWQKHIKEIEVLPIKEVVEKMRNIKDSRGELYIVSYGS